MLTLSLIKNSIAAAKYYAKEDNYYLAEADTKEASLWWGKGAAKLGFAGKVAEKDLQELFEGNLPDGTTIGLHKDGTKNHRAGYDLCFHAPKSVSILALDGEDGRFYDAHLTAVKETLAIIEKDCAQVKVLKKNKIVFENTQNLTIALIRHTASRERDPHLHHHALVMNMTQKQDGSWRSLASSTMKSGGVKGFSEQVYDRQIYYGAIYKNALANQVVKLGCEIEPVGKHGMWEIKGIPKQVIELMSKRRRKIEAQLEKLHYQSLKAADVASLDTRVSKQKNLSFKEIKKTWQEELAATGFSSREFIAKLSQVDLTQKIEATKATDESSLIVAKQTIRDAITQLSQYNLKLDYAKIIALGLEFSLGKLTHSNMVQALELAIKNNELIPVDKNNSLFVTKDLLGTEKTIMDLAEQSKKFNLTIELKEKVLANIPDSDAKDLAISILQENSRLSIVEANFAAATNNTALIEAILHLAEPAGKTVRVLSPNRLIANDINENIKRKPNNLWQWLVSLGKPEIGECIAGFKHKYQEEIALPLLRLRQGSDVIIVNSAETLACSDLKVLLELTEKTKAKVIFLRDTSMKQSFTAGNAIETLKTSIHPIKLNTPTKKLNYTPEVIAVSDDTKRSKQLAQAYALNDNNAAVIVSPKEQIKQTTELIREELKNQGKLSRMEYSISILDPVYLSQPESTYAHKYQKNMVLRFYDTTYNYQDWQVVGVDKEKNLVELSQNKTSKFWNPQKHTANVALFKTEVLQLAAGDKLIATSNMKEHSVKNATKFTVQNINNNTVELLNSNGQITKTKLNNLHHSHFRHDYVTTISKGSKKPIDTIFADIKAYVLDKTMLNELTSRSKNSLTIFTNDLGLAAKKLEHTPIKLTAAETVLSYASNKVDRFITNQTTEQIKNDIEIAITNIISQNELARQAERQAVAFALEKLTSRSAGFEHKDLVTAALEYALKELISPGKTVTHQDLERIITEKHETGELVIGKHFYDGTRWTTQAMLDLERSLITEIKKGQNKLVPNLNRAVATKLLAATNLTQDQKNACHLITTTKDQFVIVQGYAGTGKTTMFAQVKTMLQNQEMLAVAPTHRAVKELKSLGIEAQTLKSFLLTSPNLDNKLIILDEASMVPNKDMVQFIAMVGASNSHSVLSGDRAQYISIEAGKPFELLQKTNLVKTAYLREIIRQKNPKLKTAVEHIITQKYAAALELIADENPKIHLARTKDDFFTTLSKSIVEIDNNKLQESDKTLEQMVAEDFLSRTPEVQDQTVIIVYAHTDRKVITDFIRQGLKDQGVIANQGIKTNCLIPKRLTSAEHKSMNSYNLGDVVKYGKTYYHVAENNKDTKSILLQDEAGKHKHFYPQKDVDKYNVELYHHTLSELAIGDKIRLTKTDKERRLYANFEYRVQEITASKITLAGIDTAEQNLILNPKELKDAHWDYAQTVTGYGIQGGSKKYVIDFAVSYQKHLANQRSFYIGSTRAIEHVMIYTDNKEKLLSRICSNPGDKYAALEVVGELEQKTKTSNITPENRDAIQETIKSIKASAESLVERLLGRPNEKLSSATKWRYGTKGSLTINMSEDKKGLWYNFETGESGDLLSLLQKETGLAFKDALKYAGGTNIDFPKKNSATKNIASTDKINTNKASKTNDYAQQLIAESLPITGTIVEKYLKETRGINQINTQDIRYHPRVFTDKDSPQKYLPVMLAIARNKDGKAQCVQATYLDPSTATKANIATKKRTYSSPSGSLVSLQNYHKNTLSFIAEGIETGLSIKDAVQNQNVFVTLGKTNFKNLNPEALAPKVIFCLDNDGHQTLTDDIIHQSARRLINQGKEVFIAIPDTINNKKTDFNDVAKQNGISVVKLALDKSMPYNIWKDKSIISRDTINQTDKIKIHFIDKIKQKERDSNYNLYNNLITKQQDVVIQKSLQSTQQFLSKTDREIY